MPPKAQLKKPTPGDKPKSDTVIDETGKQISPAEAAAAEAQSKPITFEFRGQEFTVPHNVNKSARLVFAMAANRADQIILELLAAEPDNQPRFMDTLRVGDEFSDVVGEFFEAFNAAAGWGNSSTS